MGMLVVNPNNRIRSPFAAVEPPLWAGLIADQNGAPLLDAEGYDLTLELTEAMIRSEGVKDILLVVMGNNPSVSSTPKMAVAEALAKRLKDLNVSFAGLHPLAVGKAERSEVQLGFIPWEQLPMFRYRAHNWHCLDGSARSGYASIYTSLGCPFDCYYCNIHTLYGDRHLRLRPIEHVHWEVNKVASRYKVRNIKIWDELFALNEQRVIDICSGFPKGLNIWAYARLDTVTSKMLRAMKDGGINWLAYGFESLTDQKCRDAERVIRMTREADISIIGNFMFGLPGTTPEDDRQSLDFAKKHLLEFVNLYDAKPYPGSQWYEDTKPKDIEFDQYKSFSAFRQKAFEEYFTNPAYLDMIRGKWGGQAVCQIKDMVAWTSIVAR